MSIFDDATPREGFPVLEKLSWLDDPKLAIEQARSLLTSERDLASNLAEWLSGLQQCDVDLIIDCSPERSTHYKWRLGGNRRTYLVWLHQYKAPEVFAVANTFAASIHNHRMAFVSRVLSGALHVTWYKAIDSEFPIRLSPIGRSRLGRDTITLTQPEEIHEIREVEDNTFTFLIQAAAAQHASTIFRDGKQTQAPDLDELFPGAIAQLRKLATPHSQSCRWARPPA